MVLLETVPLCHRRDHRFFHAAVGSGFHYGRVVLHYRFSVDHNHHSEDSVGRGSGGRLAVNGMYYLHGKRGAAFLPGDCRAVFVQNLYGSEETADLSGKGRRVRTGARLKLRNFNHPDLYAR